MSLEFVLDNLDKLDEQTKGLYKKSDETGKFVLDVGGAVPQGDYDALKAKNDELNAIAYSSDGKSYKESFEGSQTANRAIRDERDKFKKDLELHDVILAIADDLHQGCIISEDDEMDTPEKRQWYERYCMMKPTEFENGKE